MKKPQIYDKSIGVKNGRCVDLSGARFGKLVVLKPAGFKNGNSVFECKCDCGNTVKLIAPRLKTKTDREKSCGCVPPPPPSSFKDLTGQRFSRLLVVKRVENFVEGRKIISQWECLCDCGNSIVVLADNLQKGKKSKSEGTKSCGCLQSEMSRLDSGLAAKRYAFRVTKAVAIRRGKVFVLTFDEFVAICERPCSYCGDLFSQTQKGFKKNGIIEPHYGEWKHNGIDRVQSDKGYTIDNCVPCCTFCNVAKMNLSAQEFLDHVERILAHKNGLPENPSWIIPSGRSGHSAIDSFVDLSDRRFGRLVVARRLCSIGGHSVFECECDCGKVVNISGPQLKHREVVDCGCSGSVFRPLIQTLDGAKRQRFQYVRNNSKQRQIAFDLSLEDFMRFSEQACCYCGSAPYKTALLNTTGDNWRYSGLDRLDSSRGYSSNNVVPCCEVCNIMKASLSVADFYAHLERIKSHRVLASEPVLVSA